MIKKYLFACLLTVSGWANAQDISFVYGQLNHAEAITPKGSSCNIRKAPNLKSPTLMTGCMDETDDCIYAWSNEKAKMHGYDMGPWQLHSGEVVLATSQSDDFYRISLTHETSHFSAYVSKSVTRQADNLLPITRAELEDNYFGYWLFPEGPLHDVIIAYEGDELYGISNMMLGTLQDKFLVFTHSVPAAFTFNEQATSLTFDQQDEMLNIEFGPKQCREKSEVSDYDVLDLAKLTPAETLQLLTALQADKQPNLITVRGKYAEEGCAPNIMNLYTGEDESGDYVSLQRQTLTVK